MGEESRRLPIVTLVEPRPGAHGIDVALASARVLVERTSLRVVLVDLDAQVRLSTRLLPRKSWHILEDADRTVGSVWQAHDAGEAPPDLSTRTYPGQDGLVSFVPGWSGAEAIELSLGNQSALRGFAEPAPVYLAKTIHSLRPHADVVILVPPIGIGIVTRIALAASDEAMGIVRPDVLGLADADRVAGLVDDIGLRTRLRRVRFGWRNTNPADRPGHEALAAEVPTGTALPGLGDGSSDDLDQALFQLLRGVRMILRRTGLV